jgi:purine-binding chemotaxis protein CheW
VLGLLADQAQGICQVPADTLVATHARGGGLLFSHTFRHPDTGRPVSVLDAAAVLDRPGVPTVADVSRDASAVGSAGGAGARRGRSGRRLTLLRCGPYRFAVDVAQVHTTLPSPDTRPSVLSSALCPGVIEFAGREVPVVDPLVLLGLGALPTEDTGAGLVLDFGHGYVVLALSALLELSEVAEDDVLPVPPFAVPRPELLSGMADVEGIGSCLVLSGPGLMSDPQLASLASVNTSLEEPPTAAAGGAATATGNAAGGAAYLTYSIGRDVASPLEQIAEIIPFPATLTPTAVDGLLGVVVHRRAAVPVLCLAMLLGRASPPVSASSCLLLVSVDGDLVAFAVDALRSIDPLTWTDPDQPLRGAESGPSLRSAPLVQVGSDTRLLPDLDLHQVARLVAGRRAPGLPSPGTDREDVLVGG